MRAHNNLCLGQSQQPMSLSEKEDCTEVRWSFDLILEVCKSVYLLKHAKNFWKLFKFPE